MVRPILGGLLASQVTDAIVAEAPRHGTAEVVNARTLLDRIAARP